MAGRTKAKKNPMIFMPFPIRSLIFFISILIPPDQSYYPDHTILFHAAIRRNSGGEVGIQPPWRWCFGGRKVVTNPKGRGRPRPSSLNELLKCLPSQPYCYASVSCNLPLKSSFVSLLFCCNRRNRLFNSKDRIMKTVPI